MKIYNIKEYILNLSWDGIVFLILNIVFSSLNIKIFLFIIFSFPMLIFSIIGINGDNLINVIIYMSKFIIKPKLLLYSK